MMKQKNSGQPVAGLHFREMLPKTGIQSYNLALKNSPETKIDPVIIIWG